MFTGQGGGVIQGSELLTRMRLWLEGSSKNESKYKHANRYNYSVVTLSMYDTRMGDETLAVNLKLTE